MIPLIYTLSLWVLLHARDVSRALRDAEAKNERNVLNKDALTEFRSQVITAATVSYAVCFSRSKATVDYRFSKRF